MLHVEAYSYHGCVCVSVFFFFKQKTAYEIEYGIVGSEMCIRDRERDGDDGKAAEANGHEADGGEPGQAGAERRGAAAGSYTHLTLPTSDLV